MKYQATVIVIAALLLGTESASISSARPRNFLKSLVLNNDLASAVKKAEFSLISHFQNTRVRNISPKAQQLPLEDIYFHLKDGVSVELTAVKLVNAPVVDINSINPDLEFLNMGLGLNLGDLTVEGSYEIVDKNIMSVIPVTSSGKFSFKVEAMKVSGKVGLSIVEDSFKTINYDIQFVPSKTQLTVQYEGKDGKVVSKQQDGSFVDHIKRELQYVLKQQIKEQVDEILVEMSVDEAIGDSKLAKSYRDHEKAMRAVSNGYVDEILKNVDNFVVENHYEKVGIPDIDASFSKEILWINWHGEFYTRDGFVENLSTLKRTADVSLEMDQNTGALVVFGSLGVGQLDLGYGYYSAKFMGIGPTGTLGATVGDNSLFLKVSIILSSEPVIALEDLHIEYAKDIKVSVTGLGILDWLVSSIATWVVGMMNDQIIGSLDGMLKDYVTGMLSSVDPSKYFS